MFSYCRTVVHLLLSSAVENNYIVSLFEELQNIGISDIWIGVSGELGTIHKHLLGNDAKKGALKIFYPSKGRASKKNYHIFSSENLVYMLFYGVDP